THRRNDIDEVCDATGCASLGEIADEAEALVDFLLDVDDADIGIDAVASSTAIMGNVYYDFLNSSAFTPYVGVGVGAARLQVDIDVDGSAAGESLSLKETVNDWTLAAQARAGASFDVTPNIAITADYTYFRAF